MAVEFNANEATGREKNQNTDEQAQVGVEKYDSSKTDIVFQTRMAMTGSASAQFNLGEAYHRGNGVAKDTAKAAYWYEKAAEQGFADAQYNLGVLYRNGDGVAKDAAKAAYWYEKAAEQGDADAQCNLGVLYRNGDGVAKDAAKAVYWFEKAVEQGLAAAQYNLGVLYRYGEGVAKDAAKAVYLFEKAAEQGLAKAQYNLALCFRDGDGVKKDLKKAEELFEKAVAQKLDGAEKQLEKTRLMQAAAGYQKNANIKAAVFMALGAVAAAYIFTKGTPLYIWTIEHHREIFFMLKPLLQLAAIAISVVGGATAVGLLLGAIFQSLAIPGALVGGVGGLISIFCYKDPNACQVAKNIAFAVMALGAAVFVIQLIRRLSRTGK